MPRKKGKSVSFDAMVKFFMHTYNIPTRQDIDRINARLDRIERLLLNAEAGKARRNMPGRGTGKQLLSTASDTVLNVIQSHKDGIGFGDIQIGHDLNARESRHLHRQPILTIHGCGNYSPSAGCP